MYCLNVNFIKNGLSRDHRVSITEAIKNEYPRFYIKHPLNCEIMTQRENSSKGKKSSITFDILKQLVDNFESSLKWSRLSDSNG